VRKNAEYDAQLSLINMGGFCSVLQFSGTAIFCDVKTAGICRPERWMESVFLQQLPARVSYSDREFFNGPTNISARRETGVLKSFNNLNQKKKPELRGSTM